MTLDHVFGSGEQLDTLQMAARACVLFFVLLVLARVSGMRSFSRHSSVDAVIVITPGAVLSRVIVGASPALPTIAAALVLAVMHRVIAVLTTLSPGFERVVKGTAHVVYRDGIFNVPRMRRAGPASIAQARAV